MVLTLATDQFSSVPPELTAEIGVATTVGVLANAFGNVTLTAVHVPVVPPEVGVVAEPV
jgi:hypothetical protein